MLAQLAAQSTAAYLLVAAAGVLTIVILLDAIKRNKVKKIPGPPGFPVLGHIPYLTKEPWFRFADFSRKYGPVYKLWVWDKLFVCISDPDLVKQVFNPGRGQVYYQKDKWSYDYFKDILGEGLVTAEGDHWKQNRNLLMPAFHHEALKRLQSVFEDAAERLVSSALSLCGSDKAAAATAGQMFMKGGSDIKVDPAYPGSVVVDLSPTFRQTTLEVISEVALGLKPADASVFPLLFEAVLDELNQRMFQPWRAYLPLELEHRRKLTKLNDIVYTILQSRRAARRATSSSASASTSATSAKAEITFDENGVSSAPPAAGMSISGKPIFAGGGDMLDMMLDSGVELTDTQLMDEVKTQLLAGHETSSMMLTWSLFLLAKYPEALAKAVEEVDTQLGLHPSVKATGVKGAETKASPTYDDFKNLNYVECVLNEAMRIYTPVPVLNRESTEADNLGGYDIPAGTAILVSCWALHHNPDIWGPDVNEFRPERFTKENSQGRKPFAFIPFSAGPRVCIGQHLALIEAKIILGHILRRFTVKLHPETNREPGTDSYVIPVRPNCKLRVVFTPRK